MWIKWCSLNNYELFYKLSAKKYFSIFFTWFLIFLIKPKLVAKMATLFWDVTEIQQCHHPQNIPHRVEKIKGFPLKAKFFWDTATYQKLHCKGGGGGSINPPSLVSQWGSVCMSEGYAVVQWTPSGWQWLSKILWYFANVRVLTCPKQWS